LKNIAKRLTIGAAIVIISLSAVILTQTFTAPNKQPIKVACVGDSITEGSAYPHFLAQSLGTSYQVGNFGYHGTTVLRDSQSAYMNESVFQKAKEFQPDIVIIMLGTNDASPYLYGQLGDFEDDYLALVNQFQGLASKPQLWLVIPPPIWNNGTGLSTNTLIHTIIPGIQQVANQTKLPLIDVYSALREHPEYFGVDGVHPDDGGAMLIANEIHKAITEE
jgi:acyl-CoA thioesterase I